MIITISGKAGAGKSTVAGMIKGLYPTDYDIRVLPLSAALKEFAFALGWNGKKDLAGRKLLQTLGTDCGRECIGKDIWLKHWEEKYRGFPHPNITIVDDVRFQNEFDYFVNKHMAMTIHVMGRMDRSVPMHASEEGFIGTFDFEINNVGTLDDLAAKVELMKEEIDALYAALE